MIIQNSCSGMFTDKSKADAFFANLNKGSVSAYKDYWASVTPNNNADIFRRYLFAFMSVHTSWQGNCNGYNAIKNFDEWTNDKEILRSKLKESGVGLHNNRTNFVWDFKEQFWANPKDFYLTAKKYHVKKRDSIVNKIKGLGKAKVSFALEMIHPNFARTLCLDVHMLRLYGNEHLSYGSNTGANEYRKIERHWMVNCGKQKIPSYIARCMYWDNMKNENDSRYWSYVLES